jgi:cysteine synthase B
VGFRPPLTLARSREDISLEIVGQSLMKKRDILDTIGGTPMVEIERMSPKRDVHIFAKLEGNNPTGSLKDRIAKYMIERAEAEGTLTHDKVILEPTSGNTGIALAFIARRKGYRIKVVMPENVSVERVQLLQAYGAEIVFSDGSKGTNGAILVAEEMAAKDDTYFMPYQYGNDANPRAHYETTGREILEDLPEVDVFVAGLGTGGTLMGVGRRLKEYNPQIKVVAVVPHPEDAIQGLRSLEEGFIPPILDLSLLDSRIMVESNEAFRVTKELMQKEGIFAGISSGAVVCCATRLAERMEKGNIVCLLADGGWKYLSTSLWTKDFTELKDSVENKIWW